MPRLPPLVEFIAPMMPSLVDAPPEGGEWIHEIKYDGYRTEIAVNGSASKAFTRNGHDWTERYETVMRSARALRCQSALIDGEMCVQNERGVTDFGGLRKAIKGAPHRLVLFAFDLLTLNGRDLRGEPLIERRKRLQGLIDPEIGPRIHFSEHHVGQGPAFFKAADGHGLEGIVSKRADSRYSAGKSKAWLKTKSFTIGDYSVIGIERSATGIPVALLASGGTSPAYVGDAMITLRAKQRDAFWGEVERLGTPRSRLNGTIAKREAAWVKEGLVARVRHLKGEDMLRHATVQSVGPKDQVRVDLTADRHPDDE